MGVADSGKVLRVGGRLCINPTNLATAFPHGGTALGMISEAVFQPGLKRYEVTAEEYGGEPIDLVITSETVVFGCLLRGMDSDAWSTSFEDTTTGSSSGEKVVEYPGATRAGTLASARSVKLLYSPDDIQNDPAILMYSACPILSETAELALAISQEMVVRVVFQGIRDTSGNVYQIGLLEDLTV
tara:strand:+ start:1385 stop:1939 length:555 start_codon:yes stop_codon:yes gene_type:complete